MDIKYQKDFKKQTFVVIKEFKINEIHKVGSKIELQDRKLINQLISNKFIK